jgi:hypothetical protein
MMPDILVVVLMAALFASARLLAGLAGRVGGH